MPNTSLRFTVGAHVLHDKLGEYYTHRILPICSKRSQCTTWDVRPSCGMHISVDSKTKQSKHPLYVGSKHTIASSVQ